MKPKRSEHDAALAESSRSLAAVYLLGEAHQSGWVYHAMEAAMPNSTHVKALGAIATLMERREKWSLMTYGDLAKRVGLPATPGIGHILDHVGAWCRSIGKRSLALLTITEDGEPGEGLFSHFPGSVTRETYQRERVALWRENWERISLPTLDEIAEAYAKLRKQ